MPVSTTLKKGYINMHILILYFNLPHFPDKGFKYHTHTHTHTTKNRYSEEKSIVLDWYRNVNMELLNSMSWDCCTCERWKGEKAQGHRTRGGVIKLVQQHCSWLFHWSALNRKSCCCCMVSLITDSIRASVGWQSLWSDFIIIVSV